MLHSETEICTVVEVLVESWLQLLCDTLRACPEVDIGVRSALFRSLHLAPMLCKTAAAVTRTSVVYPAVVFYERVREGLIDTDHFLDCVPARLPLFGVDRRVNAGGVQLKHRLKRLSCAVAISKRSSYLIALETEQSSVRLQKLADRAAAPHPHLPTALPLRVRAFINKVRSTAEGLRSAKGEEKFPQCGNFECNRVFFTDLDDVSVASDHFSLEVDPYWMACASQRNSVDTIALPRFCSRACERQWFVQYRHLKNTSTLMSPHIRRPSVGGSLKLAFRRNKHLHKMITRKRTSGKYAALGLRILRSELDVLLQMVNVDTGFLYVATLASRLPIGKRSPACNAPDSCVEWREGNYYILAEPLRRVAAIYQEHKTNTCIIDTMQQCRFLRALRSRASDIFLHL